MSYTYHINMNQRGEFYADIRDKDEDTIYEIQTEDAEYLGEDFEVNVLEPESVRKYLTSIGILSVDDTLEAA